MLDLLWQTSKLSRVRKCGRVAIRPSGTVDVRKHGDAVGYSGLMACGSVWACPRCSARIQAVRRLELGVLVSSAAAAGYTIAFGTMTLRHTSGQSLSQLWDGLTKCNEAVSWDGTVKRLRKALGRHGHVRATEVTHGQNGWHPHNHSLVLFKGDVSQAQLDELADAEFKAWRRAALRKGLGEPLRERYELRRVVDADVAFSDYFAKGVYDPSVPRAAKSVGFEMAGSMSKRGRAVESRTPWQILEDAYTTGDLDDVELWNEYELASRGRRALIWSRGLKAEFGVGEVSDEDIAEEEIGDSTDVLFTVTDWSPIAACSRLGGMLLGEVRAGGLAAGLRFCLAHAIPIAVSQYDDLEE